MTKTSEPMTEPLYPDVSVQLTGQDGNALAIIGAVCRALRAAGEPDAAKEFSVEAMSGDYGYLLDTAMRYVDVS